MRRFTAHVESMLLRYVVELHSATRMQAIRGLTPTTHVNANVSGNPRCKRTGNPNVRLHVGVT